MDFSALAMTCDVTAMFLVDSVPSVTDLLYNLYRRLCGGSAAVNFWHNTCHMMARNVISAREN